MLGRKKYCAYGDAHLRILAMLKIAVNGARHIKSDCETKGPTTRKCEPQCERAKSVKMYTHVSKTKNVRM